VTARRRYVALQSFEEGLEHSITALVGVPFR
jgi:hypothetical protein